MILKIKCISNLNYPLSLKLHEIYEAIEIKDFYLILDENLEYCEFPKELFELESTF